VELTYVGHSNEINATTEYNAARKALDSTGHTNENNLSRMVEQCKSSNDEKKDEIK